MRKKYFAELIGTMILVLFGCGAAVFAGVTGQGFPQVGTLGVALAFGLAIVAMAYTIGKISGCHVNPAVTLAMLISKRISSKDAGMYMVFQVIGALIASAILYFLSTQVNLAEGATSTGANGFAEGKWLMAFVVEVIGTFIFLLVILGSTSKGSADGFAGLAIGLTLVLIHIVLIPLTGTSVNPARSLAPAIFEGANALSQLWVFIVAPFLGAALAAFTWKAIDTDK